jgi:hypothetical protein
MIMKSGTEAEQKNRLLSQFETRDFARRRHLKDNSAKDGANNEHSRDGIVAMGASLFDTSQPETPSGPVTWVYTEID